MDKNSMRNPSHDSLISILLAHVNGWRRASRMSREAVVELIVEAHERIGGPFRTEIAFDRGHGDEFQRMKNNADRVFRWLDDQTKDGNFMPANFIPSILAAMPSDVRCACAADLLAVAGLGVHHLAGADHHDHIDIVELLRHVLKESGEAHQAFAALIDGAELDELQQAQKEIAEAIEALQQARSAVEVRLSRMRMTA